MSDSFQQEMQQFQAMAAKLQGVVSALQGSQPTGAEGSDSQGAVQVRIDGSGLPEKVSIASDWRRRCRPESLGSAVVDAALNAKASFMESWSQNLPGPQGMNQATAPAPVMRERETRNVEPRPLNQLMEEAIAALDSTERFEAAIEQPADASGADSAGRITITLSGMSLASCSVNPRWADRATGGQIQRAFRDALSDARSALDHNSPSGQVAEELQRLDGLFDEALALLRSPGHPNR